MCAVSVILLVATLSLLRPLPSCALLSVLSWAGHVLGDGASRVLSLSPAPSLPLSVSGCLRICLCRCPCVYLTALDKRPLRPAILRKGLPYGAEMEPPRLPEALRRRPGRRSAAFGDCGGAWGCSGGVSGRSLVAPREASRAFRGAPRTLPETFFELSGEKVHFLKIELPPTREHGF